MSNRINQLSIGPASDRQTPQTDFGAMFARGLSGSAGVMAGVASAMVPGGAVISAAVSETAAMGRSASSGAAVGDRGLLGRADIQAKGAESSGASGADSLQQQREMMEANQRWTAQYLVLQNQMQQESREFNSISNILKVRHEAAKTAINNIR
ncbi:MAG TPA: hypothetical protein DFS52_14490 [Myxococcales bacterium]|nr:hypothetical protein [Myxococcales bacterium]